MKFIELSGIYLFIAFILFFDSTTGSGNKHNLKAFNLGESCSENSQCVTNSSCINGTCACDKWFVPNANNSVCLPMAWRGDECKETDQCTIGSVCINNGKTMTCECIEGFLPIDEFCLPYADIGEKCMVTEQCVVNNTECTDILRGTCECKKGYMQVGRICMKVAEIGQRCNGSMVCGKRAECSGNETCECIDGYIPDEDKLDCKATLYGRCEIDGDCFQKMKVECKKGFCECKKGYEDINGICKAKLHYACNVVGCVDPFANCDNRFCYCNDGYEEINHKCAAGLNMNCTQKGGCANTFAECGSDSRCMCKGPDHKANMTIKKCEAKTNSICTLSEGCMDVNAWCSFEDGGNWRCRCMSKFRYSEEEDRCVPDSGSHLVPSFLLMTLLLKLVSIFQ